MTRSDEALERLVRALVIGRLTREDAPDLLLVDRDDLADLQAEQRELALRKESLRSAFRKGLLTESEFEADAREIVERLSELGEMMTAAERVSVLGAVLSHPWGVEAAYDAAPVDRQRAIISELLTVTVKPVGSGRRAARLDPATGRKTTVTADDVEVTWKA